jgi:hypothetical protein
MLTLDKFASLIAASLILLGSTMTTGCSRTQASDSEASMKATAKLANVPTELVGYNHTSDEVEFSVDGLSGGILQPGTGGGKFICCLPIPAPWHAGMTVKVEWRNSTQSFMREVSVPQYDPGSVAYFNIHFLRSGEVKVFPLRYGLYHSGYPLTGKEAELIPGKPIVPLN